MTLRQTIACVKIQNSQTEYFNINSGVRQGDSLSAVIFNLLLNFALSKVDEINKKGTIISRPVQLCGYADDLALIGTNKAIWQETFQKIVNETRKIGIEINCSKTKYLLISATENTPTTINIGSYTFEGVDEFRYLGFLYNNRNSMSISVNDRIQAGNRAFYSIRRLMQSSNISRKSKLKMYKTLIRPVVTYGCEVNQMTEADQNKIATFERKILRKIFGPVMEADGSYRIRYNHELNEIMNADTITKYIRKQRLQWAGHVVRMPQNRVPNKIFESELPGPKRRGRPRKRWVDNVREDAAIMRIRDWKEKAKSRDEWKRLVMRQV